MRLEATTAIDVPPERVLEFFDAIDRHYLEWHPDHISFEWVEGDGLAVGNVAAFEETIGGEHKQQTVRYTVVDEPSQIELVPTSRLVRLVLPSIRFTIEPRNGGSRVTQQIRVRTGPIGRRLNRNEFDAVQQHMDEEAENLKQLLEDGG